ncbi:alpha/beta hydrolase [Streptomyces sp. NPDC087659]|uniref:alpha/beta hydrolase n=1 Tax=Streptomyces sp. NPDC087659 TaxID=3365801 RepID=UPI00382B35C2
MRRFRRTLVAAAVAAAVVTATAGWASGTAQTPVTGPPPGTEEWRADRSLGHALPDPGSASPAEVAAFFADLTPRRRELLAARHPSVVGNLDGAPAALRYRANARTLGAGSDGRQILAYDPRGRGQLAEVFGDLTRARRVAVVVPGSDIDAGTFDRTREMARSLYEEANGRTAGGRTTEGRGAEDRTTEGRTSDGRTAEDRTTDDRAAEDHTTDDRTAEDRTTNDRTAEDHTTDGPAADDRTTDDRTADDRTTDGPAAEDRTTDDLAADSHMADASRNDRGEGPTDGRRTAHGSGGAAVGGRAGNVAVIAWAGYTTPVGLGLDAATGDLAEAGAERLARFTRGVAATGAARPALFCHSYGSVVCGLAAERAGATDIVAFGSPGMRADSVADLHTDARVWAAKAPSDWISKVPHVALAGLGHGTDPTAPEFGARRVPADDAAGHTGYLAPGSSSLRAFASIARGEAR